MSKKDSSHYSQEIEERDIIPKQFFPGAGRGDVLSQMESAFDEGVPIILLTGDEGTGKTTLCQMLSFSSPSSRFLVNFSKTVESFASVVKTIAHQLGIKTPDSVGGKNVDHVVAQIIEVLLAEERSLLVIVDEAENIYLATLERIRKMLDIFTEAGVEMHLLFAGRQTLVENCEQLSICDFSCEEEKHFELAPLSYEQTTEYIKHFANLLPESNNTPLLNKAIIDEIDTLAQGNISMIDFLVKESLLAEGDGKSFMMLLDSVRSIDDTEQKESWKIRLRQLVGRMVPDPAWYPWLGGAASLVVLFILFFSMNGEQEGESLITKEVVQNQAQQKTSSALDPSPSPKDKPDKKETVEKEPPQRKVVIHTNTLKEIEEQDKLNPEIIIPPPSSSKEKEVNDKAPTEAKEKLENEQGYTAQKESEKEVIVPPAITSDDEKTVVEGQAPDVFTNEQQTNIVDNTGQVAEVENVEELIVSREKPENRSSTSTKSTTDIQQQNPESLPKSIVELHPVKELKRRPPLPSPRRPNIIVSKPQIEVRDIIASNAHMTVEQLFQKRLLAGSSWRKGQKNNLYTIQLMVLTSKNSEKNLQKMLSQDKYKREAGRFYIFKKTTTPEQLFVFYGEYSSIARARLARNRLPTFLREHKPYAISIKGALGKIRR